MVTFLSRLLIISGVLFLLLGFLLLIQRYNPNRVAFATEPVLVPTSAQYLIDTPKKLRISERQIEQDIVLTEVMGGKWENSNHGVSYLVNSAIPGEVGNSIMYGHNWSSILGKLKDVQPNDLVTVQFESGKEKQFLVEYVFEVKPSQVDILGPTDYPRLTIYTCSGFLDRNRLVVVAKAI
jgi:sortase (surface protein transpeptidase)